jgi:hypothetical protein
MIMKYLSNYPPCQTLGEYIQVCIASIVPASIASASMSR